MAGGDSFSVDFEPYEGLPIGEITREELEKQAVRVQASWRDNLRKGQGAEGSHGGPYVNTGEAVNDIVYEFTGDLEVRVGGDVVQLAVAEFGRAPGSPPPYDAIATWAREKGLQPEDGSFSDMVDAIRWAIAEHGLEPFAPAQAAANKHRGDLPEQLNARLQEELEQHATDG